MKFFNPGKLNNSKLSGFMLKSLEFTFIDMGFNVVAEVCEKECFLFRVPQVWMLIDFFK